MAGRMSALSVGTLLVVVITMLLISGLGAAAERPMTFFLGQAYLSVDERNENTQDFLKSHFGFTMKAEGVPDDAMIMQKFAALRSAGNLPHVVRIPRDLKLLKDLATKGEIIPLDKYMNDKKNYPNLAAAIKGTYAHMIVNGRVYGLPSSQWDYDEGPSFGLDAGMFWFTRRDLLQDIGLRYPTTTGELLTYLRKIKSMNLTSIVDGKPIIPIGFPAGDLIQRLDALFGGGWEVDSQKHLVPAWATVERYDGMKFFNLLWREGLVDREVLVQKGEQFLAKQANARYAIYFGSTGHGGPYAQTVQRAFESANKKVTPEVAKLARAYQLATFPAIFEDPSKPGNVVPALKYGNWMVVVTKNCPDPDAVMKYFDWILSPEGMITAGYHWLGPRGMFWDWAPGKENKEIMYLRGKKNPSEVYLHWDEYAIPLIVYLEPQRIIGYRAMRLDLMPPDQKDYTVTWTNLPDETGIPFEYWAETWNQREKYKKYLFLGASYSVAPIGSEPKYVDATAKAETVWRRVFADVLTQETAQGFEKAYTAMIEDLLRVADWKSALNSRQKAWEEYLEENRAIDDRAQLSPKQTIRVIPQLKKVMGW